MTETIAINATPEKVWKELTDLEGRVRWSDRLRDMPTVDGEALALGNRMRIRVDRSRFKVTVTEFDPPTHLVTGAKHPLMSYSRAYLIREVSEGVGELSLTGALGGALGSVMGALSKNRMRRDLRDELAPIKEAAEATAD